MVTSEQMKLIENYSQRARDSKPVGSYTTKQIIELEHKWRLNLTSSGFSDYEKWDNKPRKRKKTIRFIKGHIRRSNYIQYSFQVAKYQVKGSYDKERNEISFWKGFSMHMEDASNYYRLIGLYAHQAPAEILPEKYREVLQMYAEIGSITKAIRAVGSKVKSSAVEMHLRRNIDKILNFVNQLEEEDDRRIS